MSEHQQPTTLSADELRRYQRHLSLPQVGMAGQLKLKQASVLLIGAGGLGSPLALYLTAAGVGRLGLVDFDRVEASNLQRQVIYGSSDVGQAKLAAAQGRLNEINPHVQLDLYPVRIDRDNALDILRGYDIVADGSDNFATRYLVNDACVLSAIPNVHASVFQFEGQVSVFGVPTGPCYRCLHPRPPPAGMVPSCAEGGVLGVVPGLLGSWQAAEVIKLVLGLGEPLVGSVLLIDLLTNNCRKLTLKRDPDCPLCGDHPSISELIDYPAFCSSAESWSDIPSISVDQLKTRRAQGTSPFVLDVRRPHEAAVAALGADQLIPLENLDHQLDQLEAGPEQEIVVHCHSGDRAARAVKLLQAAGYQHVFNLSGGIQAWQRAMGRTGADE